MDNRGGRSQASDSSRSGNVCQQLEDESQLWNRAIRVIDSQLNVTSPRDQVFWKTSGNSSKCVSMSLGLSRFVRTSLLKVSDELESKRLALDELQETERHLQTDLRYAQEKMQLYKEKLASLQQGADSARHSIGSSAACFSDALVSDREQEIMNSKNVANSRAKALEGKVESQEVEIQRLRRKLQALEKSELDRHSRQQEIFRSFKNRKPTKNSPLDNKILDIIDSYEKELQRLRQPGASEEREQDEVGAGEESSQDTGYRLVIDELSQQIVGLTDEVQRLDNERELLCTEMESRPTNSDHVLLMSKLNRYERLLKRHNIDASKDSQSGHSRECSTRIDDVEMLPLSQCQKYLKEAGHLLGIEDLKDLKEAITDLNSISDAYGLVHPVLLEAEKMTQDEGSPAIPDSIVRQLGSDRFQCLLPIVDHWRSQLLGLPELQQSLERLFARLYPWVAPERLSAGPDVKQLIAAVDRMSSDDSFDFAPGDGANNRPEPPYAMLLGIVDHFRRLFDVGPTSAVLTKINSVYAELGAKRNALNSIRDTLGLEESCSIEAVVQAVAKLFALERQSINSKMEEIFSQEDVQAALDKLDEYEQFFPIFEDLVKNLMAVLNVDRIDEILPAITSYKCALDSQTASQL